MITLAGEPLISVADVPLPGRHMRANVLGAAAAAHLAGAESSAIGRAIREFPGVPHRLETVGNVNGVRWVNDSQATIPMAAIAALDAFDAPIVVIAGGQGKGLEQEPFAEAIVAHCRVAVLIGETGEELENLVAGRVPVRRASSMDEAVSPGERRGAGGGCRGPGPCRGLVRHVRRLRRARRRVPRCRRPDRSRTDERRRGRQARHPHRRLTVAPEGWRPTRAARAGVGAAPGGAGAHGLRDRDGVLGVERSLLLHDLGPGNAGPRTARVGHPRRGRPAGDDAPRLPSPPLPGDPDLRRHPCPAGAGAASEHRGRDQRLPALDRHPRRRHAAAGRVRQARGHPLPGPLARPPRHRGAGLRERVHPVRAARRPGVPAHRRRAGPRHCRRLRDHRHQHLLHVRRQPAVPGDHRRCRDGSGVGDDLEHELPAGAGADLHGPVQRPPSERLQHDPGAARARPGRAHRARARGEPPEVPLPAGAVHRLHLRHRRRGVGPRRHPGGGRRCSS